MKNLSRWKKNLKDMIRNPWDYEGNSDHPNCPECDNIMNFYGHDKNGDFPLGKGYWECPHCRFKITEAELRGRR